MTIHNPLYKMLGNARARRKLTLKQVSEATGMTLATYHRIEIGERTLSVESAKILGEFYGIKPAVLLGLEEAHEHTWEKQYEMYEDGDDSYTWINLCRCGAWQKKKLFRRTGMKPDQAIITNKSENA